MTLEWKGTPGNIVAVGAKGIYTIQSVGSNGAGMQILQGVGHDTLPMLNLPSLGQTFISLDKACEHAERLDTMRVTEAQVSGA